jgi:putative phage-type endonuclease
MHLVDCVQGSPEWFAARCGRVTASRICDVIARTKTGWGASRANYMGELIAERLCGVTQPGYTNAAMQWGTECEPEARASYAFYHDQEVTEVGFVHHPRIIMAGASPDGLAGEQGLVEIKCPNIATHIETLLTRAIPEKYIVQMQWQLACTGRLWCDYISFDPRLPEEMRLFVRRVVRDNECIANLERSVEEFLNELEEKLRKLRECFGMREAA